MSNKKPASMERKPALPAQADRGASQRVSIKNATPVENPLVVYKRSASDDHDHQQRPAASASAADPPQQQQSGRSRLPGPVVTLALTALAAMWGLLLWMLCAHSAGILEMKAFWLCLIAAGAATLFMLGRTARFKSFVDSHPHFRLVLRCYQTVMCLAPVVDMGTDGLAAAEFAMDEEAPSWWLVFSLLVMGLTLRGAAVLKYYTTVLIAERGRDGALPYWLYDRLPEFVSETLEGQGGSFSFAYIPLAFVPGLPWCCRQHSIYQGYTAASEQQKKKYTDNGKKPEPIDPWACPLYTLLLGLCSELLLMPACLVAGPIIICRESLAAMPETFQGKVANPAPHPFADKLQVVLLLQFQFLDGAVEATPQTGLQIHAYLLGQLPAAVFFPSLAISLFNIMKTAFQFAENKELIRFVEEANSGHVSEGAAQAYVGACSSVTEMDLSRCNLGPEGAKGVAQAMRGNAVMMILDISNNNIGASGAMDIAAAISTMGAMKSLNISNNQIRAAGAKHIAAALPECKAMTSLNISNNKLLTKEAGKVLGDMLKAKSVLKELNVSGSGEGMARSKQDGPGFAKELADGISANRALTSLNVSNNNIGAYDVPPGWTFDGSSSPWRSPQGNWQKDPPPEAKQSGVVALADTIPTMRALASLDLSSNDIPSDQQTNLKRICNSKDIGLKL